MNRKITAIGEVLADLGEGPSWLESASQLYWVDINKGLIHIHDPATSSNRMLDVGFKVGAAVPRQAGGLVLATVNGFYFIDTDTGHLSFIHDPESDVTGNRFNDGKCDAAGRFWAGTMGLTGQKGTGALYCLDTDLTVRKVIDNITCSNGLAWSADNKTMYYIDSPTKQVVAYDYDLAAGEISNGRVAVQIEDNTGVPDGMTIDDEGMLWVAQWGGHQVSRWNPATGEKLGMLPIPATQVTSCVFGGPRLDTLYITSARTGLNEQALAAEPLAGSLFRAVPGVRGTATMLFGG
ncbi:SMP-30/gluconolactonase/LRE family protein [Paenibacillaceae bacterium]|nr:SMP-30/gluconolactonase/LRE family protein [Paenibacillaceae bacterium]